MQVPNIRLHRNVSRQVLSISREGVSTAPQSNVSPCPVTLKVKFYSQLYNIFSLISLSHLSVKHFLKVNPKVNPQIWIISKISRQFKKRLHISTSFKVFLIFSHQYSCETFKLWLFIEYLIYLLNEFNHLLKTSQYNLGCWMSESYFSVALSWTIYVNCLWKFDFQVCITCHTGHWCLLFLGNLDFMNGVLALSESVKQ